MRCTYVRATAGSSSWRSTTPCSSTAPRSSDSYTPDRPNTQQGERKTVVSSTAGGGVVALEVDDPAARAAVDAERAARDAGLTVRAAESVSDLQALIAVGEDIWGPNGTLAINEMRAVAVAGGVLLGAYDLAAETKGPVGFLVGFLGWNGGLHVHSHQTGVLTGRSGGGVGYALKLAQREVCLRHGIDEVRWTFDPLVRRNTSFLSLIHI